MKLQGSFSVGMVIEEVNSKEIWKDISWVLK
jgi:hypothetical protein